VAASRMKLLVLCCESFPLEKRAIVESNEGVRLFSHFLAWVQASHWHGKKKNRRVWGGERAISGLASLADIFPI